MDKYGFLEPSRTPSLNLDPPQARKQKIIRNSVFKTKTTGKQVHLQLVVSRNHHYFFLKVST
jgi:hypothetical protein